ncbi:MAG: hypothetical protein GWN81_18160 [Phycisphaerae bacterium]|nr:hypothetical protein [Phycisphaerae bacterium]NIW44043.1 hypothetical protein [Gammaproteobacteria bacterium]
MRKILIVVTLLASLLFVGATFAYSHVLWLASIEDSSFIKLSGNIFIDPALEEAERQKAISAINEGKARISKAFGLYTATPVVVITGTAKNAKKYGLGGFPAKAFAAPWNQYVVVNYQIENIDLIAHELMHAQLREVVGYWIYLTEIPTWFDEGVAMQVDHRERYEVDFPSFPQDKIERVRKLTRPSRFWTDSKEEDINNYLAAKAAVHQVLAENTGQSLFSMLSKVRIGHDFNEVFGE